MNRGDLQTESQHRSGAKYGEAFLRPIKAGSNDVVGVHRRIWPFGPHLALRLRL